MIPIVHYSPTINKTMGNSLGRIKRTPGGVNTFNAYVLPKENISTSEVRS